MFINHILVMGKHVFNFSELSQIDITRIFSIRSDIESHNDMVNFWRRVTHWYVIEDLNVLSLFKPTLIEMFPRFL